MQVLDPVQRHVQPSRVNKGGTGTIPVKISLLRHSTSRGPGLGKAVFPRYKIVVRFVDKPTVLFLKLQNARIQCLDIHAVTEIILTLQNDVNKICKPEKDEPVLLGRFLIEQIAAVSTLLLCNLNCPQQRPHVRRSLIRCRSSLQMRQRRHRCCCPSASGWRSQVHSQTPRSPPCSYDWLW
jgi:hypothetical protein